MAFTPEGGLIAWVYGGKKYVTGVNFEKEKLVCRCTCPYGGVCKHAVAVVLDYLDRVKKNLAVPMISEKDKRLAFVPETIEGEEDEELVDEEDDSLEEGTFDHKAFKESRKGVSVSLKELLEEQTKAQLVELLAGYAEKHPSIREDLQHRQNLSKGAVKKIVADIRREIIKVSSEPAWTNHWKGEGYIPDYSRIKMRLESLLSAGHADEVIALGKELIEAGAGQIEMSHDEGETSCEISSCLEVVFRALHRSSLSPAQQMLWAIDAVLEDDYDLCSGLEFFWDREFDAIHWGAVADELLQRLNRLKPPKREDEFSSEYDREGLGDWIIHALEKSGRHEEIIPLCEQEAVKTGTYIRLVDRLLEGGRKEEAEEWIRRGVKATEKYRAGIASQLRDRLREMREKEGDWPRVAAIRADDFIHEPSHKTYRKLKSASENAGVWTIVRKAALFYLETGKSPRLDPEWPLPDAEVGNETPYRQDKPPMIHTLIDIGIEERDPDMVLRWFDHPKPKERYGWAFGASQEDRIAHAIGTAYPDRALAIWKGLAESQIALTKPSAYEVAAGYLKNVRDLLMKSKREEEWKDYLTGLRQANARKPSFIKTLDRLEGMKIIDGRI